MTKKNLCIISSVAVGISAILPYRRASVCKDEAEEASI